MGVIQMLPDFRGLERPEFQRRRQRTEILPTFRRASFQKNNRLPELEKPRRLMRSGTRDVSLLFTMYDHHIWRKYLLALKQGKRSAECPPK